jgi:GH15 family glucan-1,4-alpha-glucosidase
MEPQGSCTINYWIIAGDSIPLVKGLQRFIQLKTVDHIIRTTKDYWHAWVNKIEIDFKDLNENIIKLFKRSLLIIRTHIDNEGAIIASGDSDILQGGRDTYSYMWPRDGAITALALDEAGYFEVTGRFFEFCNSVLSEEGYLFHKYRSDKSLGSSWHPWVHKGKRQLAIQEDETALVLYALWNHYLLNRNLEFVEQIYNSFIKKTADFLYFYRDDETNLPYGSYDLWEEKFGTSTYTASAVYGALLAACNFAHVLGKEDDSKKYFSGARSVREAIIKHLYNKEKGYFYKLIDLREKNRTYDETIDISSFYGPFRFGVLDPTDVRLKDAFKTLQNSLCCNIKIGNVGGAVRYFNDKYQIVDDKLPGNPWFVTTLWLYQYNISQAETLADLKKTRDELLWVCERALPSGMLSEQLNPYSGEQLSVSPLVWSHAELILTVFDYLKKYKKLSEKK